MRMPGYKDFAPERGLNGGREYSPPPVRRSGTGGTPANCTAVASKGDGRFDSGAPTSQSALGTRPAQRFVWRSAFTPSRLGNRRSGGKAVLQKLPCHCPPPGRKELAAAAVPGFNAAMPQPIRNNRAVTGQIHGWRNSLGLVKRRRRGIVVVYHRP
jgi:hypothetical protein